MTIKKILFLGAICILFALSWPFIGAYSTQNTSWVEKEIKLLKYQGLNEKALRLSLIAYNKAKQKGLTDKQLLTVIDYSKPATEKRLWVFDLNQGKTLINTWVSHGRNSGGVSANSFSNSQGSKKTSLGVFLTDHPYMGGKGYSLRLRGLEHGINDNAYSRSIVMHPAGYVNPKLISRYGQIGRSWGCPAVSPTVSKQLINTIKEKTVLVAYYPDRNWLSHSSFLVS